MNSYSFEESNYLLNQIIQSILYREHEQNPIQAWRNIDALMHIVRQYPKDSLFIVTDCGNGVKQVTPTLLADAVILTLANCMEQVASYYPIYTFNPFIDIFVRNAGNGGLIDTIRRHESLIKQDSVHQNNVEHCVFVDNDDKYSIFVDMAMGIDDFINQIREEMRSPWFKKLIYNAQHVSNNNYKGLLDYNNALFDRHSRLLVLRVDLGYQMGNAVITEADIQQQYLKAKSDFKHFLDNMGNNKLFEHVVGYVWKLEFGPDKGWHYHVMFFLDGSIVREDKTIAMLIGEYWKNDITQGRGLYYNCNAFKDDYETPGIGMINYYDLHLRQGLNIAAEYLTKTDHVARAVAALNSGRTFAHKAIPEPKAGNTGRPRSFDPELFY